MMRVQKRSFVHSTLQFTSCPVEVPSSRGHLFELRHHEVEEFQIKYAAKSSAADAEAMLRNLVQFQSRLRTVQAWRLDTRQLEFERWYHDCRRDRYVLTALSSAVLAVIAVFTLEICLMAAAAFTLAQSVEWVVQVAQSIALQLLVAGPAVDLLLFLLKLLISWLLLHVGRRRQFLRQRQALKTQASQLAKRESSVAEAASAALARTDALQVVATGDEDAVRAERAVQL